MYFIWSYVELFCRIYWILVEVSAATVTFERDALKTWEESHAHCEQMGKELFDVKSENSDAILMTLLNDTEQAWVAATVEFSPFLKQPDCMKYDRSQQNETIFNTDIMWNCLKFCEGHYYLGLKDKGCLCLNDASRLHRANSCAIHCENYILNPCGGEASISLYEKVNQNITKKIAAGVKECVYVRSKGGVTELYTGSCIGDTADGTVCERGPNTTCKSSGGEYFKDSMCRVNRSKPIGWKEAKSLCADMQGQLVSAIPSSILIADRTYWLGFHRAAKVVKAKDVNLKDNDTICAVARKVGVTVMIEGGNCFEKHAPICQDQEFLESTTSSGTHKTEKPGPRNRNNSEQTDGLVIYVAVPVFVIMFSALVITIIVCSLRRRRQQSQHLEVRTTDSSSEQHALLQRQGTNPPAKPSRKAQSKTKHAQTSYENVVLVRSEPTRTVQQLGHSKSAKEDYDKIYLDKEHREEKDKKKDDIHVYDHTSLRTTEDHYDLTDLSGVKTTNPDPTYDSATCTKTLNTYSMKGEEGRVDSESEKHANKDYYTTDEYN